MGCWCKVGIIMQQLNVALTKEAQLFFPLGARGTNRRLSPRQGYSVHECPSLTGILTLKKVEMQLGYVINFVHNVFLGAILYV